LVLQAAGIQLGPYCIAEDIEDAGAWHQTLYLFIPISSFCMHAVCIPVHDEARLGLELQSYSYKIWATPSVVTCHTAEDYGTVVEA